MIQIKFDKTIRPLVLIMPKMSGYVKILKIKGEKKDNSNKVMSFRIDYENLLKNIKLFGLRLKI